MLLPGASGLCVYRGGWDIVVIPAGYLGSMAFGALILIVANRTQYRRAASFGLGLLLVACTAFFVTARFDFFYGLAWGAALASAGWWLHEETNGLVLAYLGCSSCLYALFDLRTLWRIGSSAPSDATLFALKVFPLPARVWAAVWGALAVVCAVSALRVSVRGR